nr:SEFIR domain-containing protein [Actinopolyspora biskrensis]
MNPGETTRSPQVYVFHANDTAEHFDTVHQFATMLRMRAGIAAELEEWSPPQRTDQVVAELQRFAEADFVLVVASPEMKRLMDTLHQGESRRTIGASLARNNLAEDLPGALRQMLPVVLPGATPADIPRMLFSYSADCYEIDEIETDDDDVQKLLHALYDRPLHAKPPLGPPHPVAAEPRPAGSTPADPSAEVLLRPGATVVLGGRTYLVHDGVETPSGEGGPEVFRQAPALLIGEPNERVWLRQVERKSRCTGESFATLAGEHDLLAEIGQEQETVPRPLALLDEGRTRTLVLAWPRRDAPPEHFETLADYVPHPAELDPIVVRRTLEALAGLAAPLESLHDRGRSHRELAPRGIVRIDEENLALRDLGAAARPAVPGERATYRASEQTHRGRCQIGPWTDAFQLAAVAYHQISGHRPGDERPVPVRQACPLVPETARASIDAALDPDPFRRPTVTDLAAAFRK